jgi:hypothetical protein
MRLRVLYDADGRILAAAPIDGSAAEGMDDPQPVAAEQQLVADFEVDDQFTDLATMLERGQALVVDTSGPQPALRTITRDAGG